MLSPQPFMLGELLVDAAGSVPERTALVSGGKSFTYKELLDDASRVANLLRERGLERGDRVAIYMDNGPFTPVAVFGASLAGAIFLVVNAQSKAERLHHVLADCNPRFMITEGRLAQHFLPAIEGIDISVFTTDVDVEGTERLETAMAPMSTDVPVATGVPMDLAALIYTSGSTGVPKGVMQTHQSMRFTADTISRYLEQTREQVVLSVLPMSFTYGLYQLMVAIKQGATLYLERNFAFPGQIVKRFREVEPNVFAGVPTIYQTLIRLHRKTPIALPSLQTLTNAAAALPTSAIEYLQEIFPNAKLYKMYGLTECTRVCYLDPALTLDKPASVGRPIPGTEVYLTDAEGNPVEQGEMGVLHVRGPHVMRGYWNKEEATSQMLVPGRFPQERVLRTGDWFKQDEDGFLYFVARSDDVIKTRGEKVSPVEVERVIYAIDGVKDCAVIGVPDETQGQLIRAYVSKSEGSTVTERSVRMHCAAHLEGYMVPTEVKFEDDLPKTSSGKVLKNALKERDLPPANPEPQA